MSKLVQIRKDKKNLTKKNAPNSTFVCTYVTCGTAAAYRRQPKPTKSSHAPYGTCVRASGARDSSRRPPETTHEVLSRPRFFCQPASHPSTQQVQHEKIAGSDGPSLHGCGPNAPWLLVRCPPHDQTNFTKSSLELQWSAPTYHSWFRILDYSVLP